MKVFGLLTRLLKKKKLDPIKSGDFCLCIVCGHQGYVYGTPTLSGVSAPYCQVCGLHNLKKTEALQCECKTCSLKRLTTTKATPILVKLPINPPLPMYLGQSVVYIEPEPNSGRPVGVFFLISQTETELEGNIIFSDPSFIALQRAGCQFLFDTTDFGIMIKLYKEH